MSELNELILQQKNKDDTLKNDLMGQVLGARNLAEWIFYDAYYNCDHGAVPRTGERLKLIYDNFGADALFGISGYWAMRCYWKLKEAYETKNIPHKPDLVPSNSSETLGDNPDENRKAFVSAQQFVSTMTHTNILMPKAIFDVVHENGLDTTLVMMGNILALAVRTQIASDKIKFD